MGYYGPNGGISIYDQDNDTGITVERSDDDDVIRFDLGSNTLTPIVDAVEYSILSGFHFNTNSDNLNFTISGVNEVYGFFYQADIDCIGIASDDPTWQRKGQTVQSRLLIQKKDAGNRNANSFLLVSDVTARSADVSFLKKHTDSSVLSSGESVGILRAEGWDGVEYQQMGYIQFLVDKSVSTGDVPGRFMIVTSNGGVLKTKFICESDDEVTVGTSRNNNAHFTVDAQEDIVQFKVLGHISQTFDYHQFIDSDNKVDIRFTANGGAVFNEQGKSDNFRIETVNQQYTFYVDSANDAIGINNSSPTSNFDINGSISLKIKRSTVNLNIDDSAYQWNGNTDAGNITFNLPAGVQNRQYKIINTGKSGNTLTITPNGTEFLLGVNASTTLSDGQSLIIGYDSIDGWY